MKKLFALLMILCSLLPSLSLADEPVTLRVSGLRYLDENLLSAYTAETGVRFEEREEGDVMESIANAFAARNDGIDLFVFTASSGLYAVKEHGYYAPLEQNDALAARLADLYPAFQRALTQDGHMVGWVVNAQPMTFSADEELLAEYGLNLPATFGELLDACQALIERDAIDQRTALFMMNSYTASDILDLYVREYIRACELTGGAVDFTRPDFAAMAERIRSEVPATAQPVDWEELMYEIFIYPGAREDIYEGMTPFPAVLPDQSGAVMTYATVVTVNPYAAHREEAVDFLAWYATHDLDGYAYDASLTEPMKSDWAVRELQDIAVALATLEKISDPTADQLDQIADLKARRAMNEENLWLVTEADIAFYRDFARNLVVSDGSPIGYDDALRVCAERFLNGAYDAQAFARACQDHIDMIYQEHGITAQ